MFRSFAVSMCLASLVGCASNPSVPTEKPPAEAALDCQSRDPELGSMVKRRKCVAVASAEEKARRKEEFKDALDRALNAEPVGR